MCSSDLFPCHDANGGVREHACAEIGAALPVLAQGRIGVGGQGGIVKAAFGHDAAAIHADAVANAAADDVDDVDGDVVKRQAAFVVRGEGDGALNVDGAEVGAVGRFAGGQRKRACCGEDEAVFYAN